MRTRLRPVPNGLFSNFWLRAAFAAGVLLAGLVLGTQAESEDPQPIPIADLQRNEPVDFAKEVFPLLKKSCVACHNSSTAKNNLNLESPETMFKGGSEGPAIVAGKGEESILLILASHRDEPVMPPVDNKANAEPFTPEELALIKRWIDEGAKGDSSVVRAAPREWRQVPEGVQPVYTAAVSPDGRFAACGRGNQVFVYDTASGRQLTLLSDPELGKDELYGGQPTAHRDTVQALAFGPHDRLATGGYRNVKIWRRTGPEDGEEIGVMPEAVSALAASADGSRMAMGDRAGNVRLWDEGKAGEARERKVHEGSITALCLSGDGTRLFTAGEDRRITVLDAASGETIGGALAPASVAKLSVVGANEWLAAAGSEDAAIVLWRIHPVAGGGLALNPERELAGHPPAVTGLAAAGATEGLLSWGADGSVGLWNPREGGDPRVFQHGAPVSAAASSPDGKRFASAGAGGSVKLWNGEDGALLGEWRESGLLQEAADQCAFRLQVAQQLLEKRKGLLAESEKRLEEERGNAVKAAESRATAEVSLRRKETEWRSAEGKEEEAKELLGEVDSARSELVRARQNAELAIRLTSQAAEAAARAQVEAASAELAVREAGSDRDAAAKGLEEGAAAVEVLAFSADGRRLYVGTAQGWVAVRNGSSGRLEDVLPGGSVRITALAALGPDGLLWADEDNGLRHRQLREGWTLERTIGSMDEPDVLVDRVTAVGFDVSGRYLATGSGVPSRSGELKVWDLVTGNPVFSDTTTHSDAIVDVSFSPDGQFVASAATDRFMRVFRAADGSFVKSFEGHTGHVLGVAWSADGLQLATAGADQVVKIWDFEEGRQRRAIEGFGKEVTSVCFIGAGETILASCGDQTLRLGDERLSGAETFLHRADASDDGEILVAGGQDSVLRIWRASDKALLHRLAPAGEAAN